MPTQGANKSIFDMLYDIIDHLFLHKLLPSAMKLFVAPHIILPILSYKAIKYVFNLNNNLNKKILEPPKEDKSISQDLNEINQNLKAKPLITEQKMSLAGLQQKNNNRSQI